MKGSMSKKRHSIVSFFDCKLYETLNKFSSCIAGKRENANVAN